MKTKRILLAIVCLLVILGGLNYLLQQSPIPIGTPGSTPAAGAAQFVGKHDIKDSPYFKHPDFYNMQSDEHLTICRNLPLRSKSLIIPVVLPLQIW